MAIPYVIAMAIGISTYWFETIEGLLNSILYIITTVFSYIYSIYLLIAVIRSSKKNNFT